MRYTSGPVACILFHLKDDLGTPTVAEDVGLLAILDLSGSTEGCYRLRMSLSEAVG
jgi:hypothetical protein